VVLVQSGVCLVVLSWVDSNSCAAPVSPAAWENLMVACPFPMVKGTIFISRLYHVSIGVVSNFFSKYDTFLHYKETPGIFLLIIFESGCLFLLVSA